MYSTHTWKAWGELKRMGYSGEGWSPHYTSDHPRWRYLERDLPRAISWDEVTNSCPYTSTYINCFRCLEPLGTAILPGDHKPQFCSTQCEDVWKRIRWHDEEPNEFKKAKREKFQKYEKQKICDKLQIKIPVKDKELRFIDTIPLMQRIYEKFAKDYEKDPNYLKVVKKDVFGHELVVYERIDPIL